MYLISNPRDSADDDEEDYEREEVEETHNVGRVSLRARGKE
jgi:hypothetical protein